jgi:K+-transporting ATPase KdpF subunit
VAALALDAKASQAAYPVSVQNLDTGDAFLHGSLTDRLARSPHGHSFRGDGHRDVRDLDRARVWNRADMTLVTASISGADLFGLIVSVLVCAYLLYALLRGEKF